VAKTCVMVACRFLFVCGDDLGGLNFGSSNVTRRSELN